MEEKEKTIVEKIEEEIRTQLSLSPFNWDRILEAVSRTPDKRNPGLKTPEK